MRAMPRLEGHGHEQRLSQARRAFTRVRAARRWIVMPKLMRKSGGAFGLLVLGAGIGASAVVLLDALQPTDEMSLHGAYAGGGVYYHSCREAFLEGRSNILRGEPGYRSKLDADGDGRACEPFSPTNR